MITSAQNKKIQEVRRLSGKRKEREASGLYIAEGIRLVEEALPHAEDCVYLLYSAPLSSRAEALVRGFTDSGVSAEEVTPQLMDSIAGTDSPQGVLAVMHMAPLPLPEKADFVVIADGIQDPGNLGTLFRTAAAAGAALDAAAGAAAASGASSCQRVMVRAKATPPEMARTMV